MSTKLKKVIILILSGLLGFLLSFFTFGGVNFVASIPVVLVIISFKKSSLLSSILGILLAALILDYKKYPFIILATIIISYLLISYFKRTKITTRNCLTLTGVCTGAVISVIYYYLDLLDTPNVNVVLIPVLCYVLSMNVINIQYDLKVRENISFTKKQMAFIAFAINLLLANVTIPIINFKIGIVLLAMINYIFTRIDPLIGIVGCLTTFALNIYPLNVLAFLSLIPLIYTLKNLRSNQYVRSLLYVAISMVIFVYWKKYNMFGEVIVVSLYLFLVPDCFVNTIHKFVIEPQDYELKLYQKSYYKCLNRNKRIQKVMGMLEENMKSNSKMSKTTKDILFKNMQFLSDKLKEEDNIRVKEQISNDLYSNKLEILGFRISSDYFYNYKIYFEIKNTVTIEDNKLIDIFQEYLQVKLRIASKSINGLINSVRYELANDNHIVFNFSLKQRSKEAGVCGDSYVQFDTKNKKYFMISDGMGHGARANRESTQALHLLKEFIELGMNPEDAILTANALLFDKQNEQFNTLDLLEYDTLNEKIHLYKNGSGVTYVKNNKNIQKLLSENLPLGIIENIKTSKISISVDNNFIVLTSDGFKKDFTEPLIDTVNITPKGLVEELLEYEGNIIEDDQTIVVINVIKNN